MFRAEDIRTRLSEQPFRPLRLIVSEGLTYDIFHPELVLVGERDLTVGFPSDGNPKIYNRQIRVALVHVVGIEDLPSPSPSSN